MLCPLLHRRRIRRILGLLMMVAVGPLSAQTPLIRDVRGSASCTECRITAHRTATLGALTDSVPIGPLAVVAVSRDRQYVGGATAVDPRILVFDSAGQLAATLGRSGDGPGESRIVWRLTVGPGDSLYVFDFARRMTVFAPNGIVRRAVPVPLLVLGAVPFSNGTVVVTGGHLTAAGIGLPLHLLRPDGSLVRSFGQPQLVRRASDLSTLEHRLALSTDGTIWTAQPSRYELQRWDTTATLREVLHRQVDWFVPGPQTSAHALSREGVVAPYVVREPPASRIMGVRQDGSGRLWVLVSVPANDWREQRVILGEGHDITPEVLDKLHDTMVEVLEPGSARVISSARLPFLVSGFVGDALVSHHRTGPNGLRMIELWRLELTDTTTRR